jgi:hypothetical protein
LFNGNENATPKGLPTGYPLRGGATWIRRKGRGNYKTLPFVNTS